MAVTADGSIDNSNPKSYLGMLYKGKGTADLDSCIYYASMVIDKHPLAYDYADLFDHSLMISVVKILLKMC